MIQYGGGPIGVRVPPGTYTVKMVVDGREFEQKILVKKDPSSVGAESDIQAQTELLLKARKNQNDLIGLINSSETIRKQLIDLREAIRKNGKDREILPPLDALDAKIIEIEGQLFQMKVTGSADVLRWPSGLVTRFSSLANEIASADFPPTEQQLELHRQLERELAALLSRAEVIFTGDLVRFNGLLKRKSRSESIGLKRP